MIFGIGTDICDVRRIEATLAAARRALSPSGCWAARAGRSSRPAARGPRCAAWRYLATRFSAKEAFSKAIGLGIRMPMTWRACEILNEPSGKPYIRLNGALAEWFEAPGCSAHVSVTDETDYAASFVVVETRENPMMTEHAPVILDIAGTGAERRRPPPPAAPADRRLILFARNWREPAQLTELVAEMKALRARPADLRRPRRRPRAALSQRRLHHAAAHARRWASCG
jgi:holo-[acyl-carrier-protein] synthase